MMIHCNILHYISWFVKRVYTLFFLFAAIFSSARYTYLFYVHLSY